MLTPASKSAIVAAAAQGITKTAIAQQFGVSRQTVHSVVSSFQAQVQDSQNPLSEGWRKTLTDSLPAKATQAIERSIDDMDNVHAAAGSGFKLLQGLGILGGETSSQTINVFVANQASLPDDIRALLCGTSDVIDVTPESSESAALHAVTDNDNHNQ